MPEPRMNQQSAVDVWYRRLYNDLEVGYHDTLAWSLVMMGRADAQLSRPAYKTFFNRYKDELMKAILTMIANKDDELRYSEREQKEMIAGVRKLGLDWLELDVIERSLNASKKIDETVSNAFVSRMADLFHGDNPMAYREFDRKLKTRTPRDRQAVLFAVKPAIIRWMLRMMRDGAGWAASDFSGMLIANGVEWSEIDTILKSLRADARRVTSFNQDDTINEEISEYDEMPEDEQIKLVTRRSRAIRSITDPSEAVQLAAVKGYGLTIQYIANPSEAVQLAAVTENGAALQYIKDPSEAVKLAAVKDDGHAIEYIKDPSEEIQLAAVTNDPDSIGYIKDPSEKTKLAAVDRNWYAITYIKDQSPALQILAVIKNPDALEYMDYAHPEFWKDDAVKTRLITYILKNIKRGGLGADHLVYMLEHLRCPWPELRTITKSLEADNKIQESEDVAENYEDDQADIVAIILEALTNGAGASMWQATRLLQSLDEIHLSKLKKMMLEKKHSIKANVLDLCFVPGRDTIDRMRDLFKAISPGWSEFQDIPYSLRNMLMAEFNNRAEEGGVTAAVDCIDALKTNGLEVTELVRDFRQEMLPRLINDFAKDPHTPDHMLADNLDTMWDIGVKPEEINGVLNARKITLVKAMLNSIKARRYNDANVLLDALQQFGMDWPELAVIENSLNSGSLSESEYANRIYAGHKYKDEIDQQVAKLSREIEAGTVSLALRGAIHVLSSRYRLRDEEIGSLLSPLMPALTERARRFLEGKAISIAIRDLKELQNIGLMTDELRSAANDNKAAIMKFLLSIIREKQNTNHTMRYIEFLEAVGIDWPEFGVIRKTAEAEFRDLMKRRDQQ